MRGRDEASGNHGSTKSIILVAKEDGDEACVATGGETRNGDHCLKAGFSDRRGAKQFSG